MISAGLITPMPPMAPTSPLLTWYDPNARCKYHMQGWDIGLMIVITLNIRFQTSSTRTSGVCILAPLVVRKERMQYHLHITRGNNMIDIESYGQLTQSPIASDIHKTIGLPPQLNVIVRYIFYTIQYSML